ncbi:hypothetical protein LINPERPRIM_LOCUS21817 [Linum perenne]
MNLGRCSIMRVEIRGAITGLELVSNYGFRQVVLQLDSQTKIFIISSSEEPMHQNATKVLYFWGLSKRDWRVII